MQEHQNHMLVLTFPGDFRMGHEKLLERILQAGAYPDAQDSRGHTGLMFAVSYGDKNITRMLLKYGASLNLRSNMGETPLLMAVSNGKDKSYKAKCRSLSFFTVLHMCYIILSSSSQCIEAGY